MFGSPNSRHHTNRSNLSFNYSSLTYDVCLLGYAYYCTVVCLFKANFMIIQQYLPTIYLQVNLHTQLVMLVLRIKRASSTWHHFLSCILRLAALTKRSEINFRKVGFIVSKPDGVFCEEIPHQWPTVGPRVLGHSFCGMGRRSSFAQKQFGVSSEHQLDVDCLSNASFINMISESQGFYF